MALEDQSKAPGFTPAPPVTNLFKDDMKQRKDDSTAVDTTPKPATRERVTFKPVAASTPGSKADTSEQDGSYVGTTPIETGSLDDSQESAGRLDGDGEEDEDEIEAIRSDIRGIKKQIKELQAGRGPALKKKSREKSTDSAHSKDSQIKLVEGQSDNSGNLAELLASRGGGFSSSPKAKKELK